MSLNIAELFENKNAELSEAMLDMYQGKQQEHLEKILSDPNKGRKDWQSRGIIPRHRNIMKMIVDKSGLLFSDKAPELAVYNNKSDSEKDEGQTATLKEMLDEVDWVEFFTNFDSVTRMLKTALVLVQYDAVEQKLVLDILTQHNCYVVVKGTKIDTLIYKVGETNEIEEFRVFTQNTIQDINVNEETGEETIVQVIPNPFGIIPVTAFHDTNIPMFDFWNVIPTDLLQINDLYNLHLTDSEYAASWSKLKTLFTNCKIVTAEDMQMESVVPYGSVLPRMAPSQGALIGGPSKVIQIDTMGVDSPFIEYKGPEVNLEPIDLMVNKWVSDYAADWCVNVKMAGSGIADSGFKLIVEEMDNLELRRKRARMFEAGFSRLFQVIKAVVNVYKPTFSETSVLFAKFAAPNLPFDVKQAEEVWSRKIAEGRASRLDYFIENYGMTKAEAQAKIDEIDSVRAAVMTAKSIQVTKTVG